LSNTVISIEKLGKQYRLGEIGTGTLSHDLNRWWARVRGKEDPFAQVGDTNDRTVTGGSDYIWALRDLDFDVQHGEVIGIIGRNGAGKSTLLKIISKVTTPSTGRIKVKGRIASLLEVGTGFHPELTGRENIFLNGAILGMTRAEIRKKFDEIVAFAGVDRYIDTPVKRYSSGMYVRLAFAVAAHLESEILIVDEVLAVGDAEFQRKCIGKMKDVNSGEGRTVLFVSHNLSQVHNFCTRGILLVNGQLAFSGDINKTISQYVHGDMNSGEVDLRNLPRAGHSVPGFRFLELQMIGTEANIYEGDRLEVHIKYEVTQPLKEVVLGLTISDAFQTLVECRSGAAYPDLSFSGSTRGELTVTIPLSLSAGNYSINIGARGINGLLEYIPSAASIEILPNLSEQVESWKKPSAGVLITPSDWKISDESTTMNFKTYTSVKE
jgi:lipopolysaccharide transport system ATP-binding protein